MVPAFFLTFFLLLAGCGYRFAGSEEDHAQVSISVPYIKGDGEGQLNSELVKALTASGLFDYVQNGGELTLHAAIITDADDRIGFRFDRDPTTGDLRDNIIGTENRRTMTIEVRLTDSRTEEVLVGPKVVTVRADYDYVDSNSIRDLTFKSTHEIPERTLDFSLGQLDSLDGAHADSSAVIFRHAAEQIVDGLLLGSVIDRREQQQ